MKYIIFLFEKLNKNNALYITELNMKIYPMSNKVSALMLNRRIRDTRIHRGQIYGHYKDRSKHYKICMIAITEKTQEPEIIYEALYDKELPPMTRTYDDFIEKVEYNGDMHQRFILIEIIDDHES